MKLPRYVRVLVLPLLAAAASAQDAKVAVPPGTIPTPTPANLVPPPAYTDAQILEEFGWYLGQNLSQWKFTPEQAVQVANGIREALNAQPSPYEIQKIGPAMDEFVRKKRMALVDDLRSRSLADAVAFFQKLKDNKDVVTLPDGLRYQIVKAGDGPSPKPSDTIKVNYTGTLLNGTVFDTTAQRGAPAEFRLDQMIPGWIEGLQKATKGGKIKLYVPPDLAYGDQGSGIIPPGATLIFDVELLDVTPAAAPAK